MLQGTQHLGSGHRLPGRVRGCPCLAQAHERAWWHRYSITCTCMWHLGTHQCERAIPPSVCSVPGSVRVQPPVPRSERHEGRAVHAHITRGLIRVLACTRAPRGSCQCPCHLLPACFCCTLVPVCLQRTAHAHGHCRPETHTNTGHCHTIQAALQSHMSHSQGTRGSPCSTAMATAPPQALFPLGAVSCSAGSHIVPAARGVSARHPSHRAQQHGTRARGRSIASVPPGMAQDVSTHPCAQTCMCVHTHAATAARSLHTHALTHSYMHTCLHGPPLPPSHLPTCKGTTHAVAHPHTPL